MHPTPPIDTAPRDDIPFAHATRAPQRGALEWAALGACALIGVLALAWAWRADPYWCARHMIVLYWAHPDPVPDVARNWRIGAIAVGLFFLLVARPFARWVARVGAREAAATAARMGLAVVLALAVSEWALRRRTASTRPPDPVHIPTEPDDRYGWVYQLKRSEFMIDGRSVEFAVNRERNRARDLEDVPDPARPSVLFAGESIAAGHGITWAETFPALVGEATGLQPVIVAGHGYGCDQAYLRLADALPRFQAPVAIVSIFMPVMVWRMTSGTHPHLTFDGATPRLLPAHDAVSDLEIVRLWFDKVMYHDDDPVKLARTIAHLTAQKAEARGAVAVFVRPSFGTVSDASLDRAVFEEQGLHVVDVPVGDDPLPGDPHPNARAMRRIADAVIRELRRDTQRVKEGG
jgi:hypothetical protein